MLRTSLLLAYDNTGALYVIGFSLYEFRRFKDKQLACSMRAAHREKKKERKERGQRTSETHRILGARETAVAAVHVKRTLVDIQSVRKRKEGEGRRRRRRSSRRETRAILDGEENEEVAVLAVAKRSRGCVDCERARYQANFAIGI